MKGMRFMTIKEMEEMTGLARSNIRFYEKEKLIEPKRNEKNGYRIYSEEDVRQIKKIAYLRTLGVPVEAIQKMIRGEATLNHVLKLQNKKLEKELLELEQAKQLCSHMLKDEALTFQNLEPDKYVGSVKDYWKDNRPALKKDRASFIYLWGSWILWGILTLLCLVTAAAGYVLIPGRLPIQWSDGAVASSVDKVFIFAYPLACVLIRAGLRPFIWRWLWLHMPDFSCDAAANYIANFLCFVLWSVELFTILFVFGAVTNVVILLVIDGLIFFGLLAWAFRTRRFD